jgi:hypothetical protein
MNLRLSTMVENHPSGEAWMKPTLLYRISSVLLVVWAAGNTYGVLRFWQVAGLMSPVHFPVGHRPLTYAQVVLGLGLFCSAYVLFGAYLAGHLSALLQKTPQAIGVLGWVLFAYQVITVYISWAALSGIALLLSAGIAICIGWASWLSTAHRPESAATKP